MGGKTRERCTIFEALCITGVNPTHLFPTKLSEEPPVGITTTLQFTRTHPLEPIDVTSDGGEVLVSVFGNGDHVFDPNAPNALISREDIEIDVFGFPSWRQQMG